MAFTFKNILPTDISYQTEPVFEAIPITGTLMSGAFPSDTNIKSYTHGFFQSVYDYTYTQASANHLLDITFGMCSGSSAFSNTSSVDYDKKVQLYNQMAQVLCGYDLQNQIRLFDLSGSLSTDSSAVKLRNLAFLNFSRLLSKDGIKKGTFNLDFYFSGSVSARDDLVRISDYGAATSYKVNSPAGEYATLYANKIAGPETTNYPVGLIFYQAGVVALNYSTASVASVTSSSFDIFGGGLGLDYKSFPSGSLTAAKMIVSGSIDQIATSIRRRVHNLTFNNTVEINSTFYLCSLGYNDFNYSSNPTYISGSKIVTKNFAKEQPVSYITTIGLYSPDNELLAVAKLSEPIKKTPSTPVQIKVRVSY